MTEQDPQVRRVPAWDPPITVALLVLGVLNVTRTVAQGRTLAASLDSYYVVQGIGRYTRTGLADGIGWGVAGLSVLCLVLAIGFAVPRLQAHRVAFWVPLVGACVSLVGTAILISIAILGDPAFLAAMQRGG
jgi:Family of unknown function (DUF6264)